MCDETAVCRHPDGITVDVLVGVLPETGRYANRVSADRRFVVYPLEATKKWLFSGIQKASSAFSKDSEHDNTK